MGNFSYYESPVWNGLTKQTVLRMWGSAPAHEIAAVVNAQLKEIAPTKLFCPRCRQAFIGRRKDLKWRCTSCSAVFTNPVIGGGEIVITPTGAMVVSAAYRLGLIEHKDVNRLIQRARREYYRSRGITPVSAALRKQVFERDDHKCRRCGATEDLEADHIIPQARGGKSILENLQTLCAPCNVKKWSLLDLHRDLKPDDPCPCGSGKAFRECCA